MAAEVADVLVRIVQRRRERMATERGPAPAADANPSGERFLGALRRPGRCILAEVKMGSPRLGSLAGRVDPEAQARRYAEAGAAALSVVVEPDHFGGSYDLLARCRQASGLPTIAKDFVVDSRQLAWAAAAGADAVLLIAALHTAEELARYQDEAERLGLVVLVETHDAEDVARLAGRRWPLVGVNNRDLRTFEVDLAHSESMVHRLPAAALKVAESGLESARDLDRLERVGFDAFLIGESLLLAEDPAARLRSLLDSAGC